MLIFAVAALLQTAPLDSPPFDMTPYYQGTLQVEQLGEVDRMLIDAGGRYIMYGVKIKQAPGKWWFDKDQFCVLPDPQPGVATSSFCMVLQGRKAGDSWAQSFGDVKVVFTLLPTRQAATAGH